MEAGRELDALVAEEVFGWFWMECLQSHGVYHRGRAYLTPAEWLDHEEAKFLRAQGKFRLGVGDARSVFHSCGAPYYSTDISAAWEVVEETRKRVSLETEFELVATEDGFWHACFGMEDFVTSDTAPLAICKAALQAVGVEVPT